MRWRDWDFAKTWVCIGFWSSGFAMTLVRWPRFCQYVSLRVGLGICEDTYLWGEATQISLRCESAHRPLVSGFAMTLTCEVKQPRFRRDVSLRIGLWSPDLRWRLWRRAKVSPIPTGKSNAAPPFQPENHYSVENLAWINWTELG